MSLKKEIVWRVGVIYLFMLVFAMLIVGKILYLQFIDANTWVEKAQKLTLKDITVESNRGDILADDGRLLASSVPYYEIRMDTRSTGMDDGTFARGVDSLAICLSRLFNDKSAAAYKRELVTARKNGERFHLIRRRVNYNQLKALKTFPIFRRGRYKGGFIALQTNIRIQPHVNLASRTIGYTTQGVEGNIVGIEGAYDKELKGVEGVRLMQRIQGNVWMPVNDGNEVEPKDGMDVVTTIDVNVQDVATNALLKQLLKHEADHGTAVLMEVKTGEIKAIANLSRTDEGIYKETYNYAIGESTEPGSTFKLASMIAALEDGYVDPEDTIDTGEGEIMYYDKKLTDSKHGGYGKITVQEVFEVSSNVGISKIITESYTGREEKFINRLYRMNLNNKLDLDIKGEGSPEIKYPGDKYWSGVSLPMMSIGYEVRLTPLQILTFYNAIANNGKMIKPKFVKALMYHGEVVQEYDTEVINPSVCSRATLRKVKKMLEGVVEQGTAANIRNRNYKIAGKTGTAQIANIESGYSDKSRLSYQASFVGYFPADQPKYSCIVVVNSPSRNIYYGNLVAGPVFKEIADKVYATRFDMHRTKLAEISDDIKVPYTKHSYKQELDLVLRNLGIHVYDDEVDSDWVLTTKKDSCVKLSNRFIDQQFMPNVTGMGVKDAVFILENLGLEIEIQGRGTVLKQSIQPGSKIIEGQNVVLGMSIQ
ncbi:MAG: penicillin-binding transpeptidase domain-containing protein [Bacteroidales bacterium]|jgi:cell division protein FtsI (penicillin-binding protein 3)|nr:penicillin-binding transpeptidase domain-containing protein [Bacteroidales bacterium]